MLLNDCHVFFEACDVRNAGLGYDTTRKREIMNGRDDQKGRMPPGNFS